jgi:hypothetical protein
LEVVDKVMRQQDSYYFQPKVSNITISLLMGSFNISNDHQVPSIKKLLSAVYLKKISKRIF